LGLFKSTPTNFFSFFVKLLSCLVEHPAKFDSNTMMLRFTFLALVLASTTKANSSYQIIRPTTGEVTLNVDSESGRESSLPSQCDLYMAQSTIPGAGLGIFTASAKQRGETVGYQQKDASIPIDMESIISSPASNAAKYQAVHLLRNYTWTRNENAEVLVLGLESLMNSHLAAANVKHFDSATVAITHIPPGGEAWSYYGDHWFRARFSGDEEEMPGVEDYERAESFVRDTYVNSLRGKSVEKARKLWEDAILKLKSDRAHDRRLWNALPKSYEDANQIALMGMSMFHQKAHVDLQEDPGARCVDSIRIIDGKAFAARDFPAGSLITGSPLLHFVEGARYLPHQFLERCFGSSESSLILCPYGPGVSAIAHLYNKDDDSSEPNVSMQWAPEGHLHQKAGILESPVSDFLAYTEPVTSVDFYASKDIKEGEALRLPTARLPVSVDHAARWNQSLSTVILRTESEQMTNPYPANLELQCHNSILHASSDDILWNEFTIVPCQIKMREISSTGSSVTYSVRALIDGAWTRVSGVHRRYIRFVDVQFDTMDISAILPEAWKNIDQPLERDEL
jgi:hypothetical protein